MWSYKYVLNIIYIEGITGSTPHKVKINSISASFLTSFLIISCLQSIHGYKNTSNTFFLVILIETGKSDAFRGRYKFVFFDLFKNTFYLNLVNTYVYNMTLIWDHVSAFEKTLLTRTLTCSCNNKILVKLDRHLGWNNLQNHLWLGFLWTLPYNKVTNITAQR